MELIVRSFSDFIPEEWNNDVASINSTSYGHAWEFLNYQSRFQNVIKNISFICYDDGKTPLAVCPFIISKNDSNNSEISSNGGPIFLPAIMETNPSKRRKLLDSIFLIYNQMASEYEVKSGNFVHNPLNRVTIDRSEFGDKYIFEWERFYMIPQVVNTLVVNLEDHEQKLTFNLSKYHRRNIRRAGKQGISVRTINQNDSQDVIDSTMQICQQIHYASAGKATRPQETWDIMRDLVKSGESIIFIGVYEEQIISYLFCGIYSKMAFGWSQANLDEYAQTLNVRHLIEWMAILYFKRNGFKYYELGERFYTPSLYHSPTEKEISISQFKQNYGGHLMTKVFWKCYFDEDYLLHDLSLANRRFEEDFIDGYRQYKDSLNRS